MALADSHLGSTRLDQIPTIDIGDFLNGSPAGRMRVVAQVRQACEEVGFFLIAGHGVPDALIKNIRDVTNAFFDLPMAEKLKSQFDLGVVGASGFEVMGRTALARSLGNDTPPDYREAYKIAALNIRENDPYYTCDEGKKYFPPTLWPSKPAGFRQVYEEYYRVVDRLAADIMRIFALALGLEEDFFADKMDKAVNRLNAIRYLPQDQAPVEGQLRAGEHTDYGTLTILLAEDKPGGLQVRLRNGKWVDVRPPDGTFVINIGDLMMHWTNDRWLSNLHRVANPPPEHAQVARLSIVFFQKPNYDAEISCLDKTQTPKYAPTTAGAHWYEKNAKHRPPVKTA
jgi:isopenicillin N synthase-like dioxygenase